MSAKKSLSLAIASAIAATSLAIPSAHAAEEPGIYDIGLNEYLSSNDAPELSLSVDGEKCTFRTTNPDGTTESESVTRSEARELITEFDKVSPKDEQAVYDRDKEVTADDGSVDNLAAAMVATTVFAMRAAAPLYRACAEGKDMSTTSSKAHTLFSSINGDLSPEGIGIVAGGTVVLLGLLAAVAKFALPAISPQLAAKLPF